jgi:hypothetical protein
MLGCPRAEGRNLFNRCPLIARGRCGRFPRGLAVLDLREDRLQQSAGTIGRARFAPQSGEIDRGAQFEDACFLAAGGVDGLQEARFRPRPMRLRPFERDVAIDPMQVGEPEPLPRLLDKGESFLERCAGACRIARREGSLGKARQDQRVTPVRN